MLARHTLSPMPPLPQLSQAPIAIVLAAGRGARMGGDLPKVLFEAAGKSLVEWVLEALDAAGVHDRIVVVGYRAELVEAALCGIPGVSFARQKEQRGTGDAVAAAAGLIESRLHAGRAGSHQPVVVVCGDSPMLRPQSVTGLLGQWADRQAACLLGTALTQDPTGLGRIVRDSRGIFQKIVEQKEATADELAICEVNMSTYVFEARDLLRSLLQLQNANASGEYYLTDCPGLLRAEGLAVDAVACLDPSETLSVNTPAQLAAVAEALQRREGLPKPS